MVEADFSGDYLNADNTLDGDEIVVKGEGEFNTLDRDGKTKELLNIPVEVKGKTKTWTPLTQDGKDWVSKFGKDTKAWIGHIGKVSHVKYKSYGQTKIGIEVKPLK